MSKQDRINQIKIDEHVFIPGRTGSGKTFLCEVYLAGFDNVVKLDTKNEYADKKKNRENVWHGLEEGKDFKVFHDFSEMQNETKGKMIYVMPIEEQTPENFDLFFKWCYTRGNTIVWIDELMSVSTARTYPKYLRIILSAGRSRNVAAWCCTQRPVDVPQIVTANAIHLFVFDLNLDVDRKKMRDVTGYEEFMKMPGRYNFWYFKMTEYYPPVKARLEV